MALDFGGGHEVKLIHATFVRPFVQGNKTDAGDAKTIWTTVRQPEMRTVAGKTEDQQTLLALHRMRLSLIKFRTMQVLYEFGVTLKGGKQIWQKYNSAWLNWKESCLVCCLKR